MAANNSSACVDVNVILSTSGDASSHVVTYVIFGVLYTAVIALGLCGNVCVIVAVSKNNVLHTARNVFLVNLSCADILVSLISGVITPMTAAAKVWLFGSVLCRIMPLLQGSSIWISTFTLTAIAIDRYVLIVHSVTNPIQPRMAIKIIAFIWAAAVMVTVPVAARQRLIPFGKPRFCGLFCIEHWQDASYRRAYGVTVLLLQFVAPMVIICFCYHKIYLKLSNSLTYKSIRSDGTARRNSNYTNTAPRMSCIEMNVQRLQRIRDALRRRQRTNRMLVTMVVVFGFCWFPQVIFHLLRDFEKLPHFVKKQEYLTGIILHWIAMTSTCWNPILYAFLNEQFRAAFLGMLPRMRNGSDILTTLATDLRRFSAFDTSIFRNDRMSTSHDRLSRIKSANQEIEMNNFSNALRSTTQVLTSVVHFQQQEEFEDVPSTSSDYITATSDFWFEENAYYCDLNY